MHRLRDFLDTRLIARARAMDQLTASLRTILPSAMAQNCWISGVNGETLSLTTINSALATHIRYQQREILKHINCELRTELAQPLRRLRIRLTHFHKAQAPPPMRRPQLPVHAARQIEAIAQDITDPGLRTALRRLARRSRSD